MGTTFLIKRQWDTQVLHWAQFAVSAWHSCQPAVPPGFPKTSISNLGSGDSRLLSTLRTQLCTVGNLAFCSAALQPRVCCPTPWGQLKPFYTVLDQVWKLLSAGCLFVLFFTNVFVSLLGIVRLGMDCRDQTWPSTENFPNIQYIKLDSVTKTF